MSLFMFAGCLSELHTDKPANIGFRPVIGHDTRADESVPFPEDRIFRLWAQESLNGSLYITDETIAYNDGWNSSRVWPEEKLTFEACWPTDIPVSFSKSEGLQIKNFDCSRGDRNILIAKTNQNPEADNLVTICFNHALSRVEFRILHSLSKEMSVKLSGIEVQGYALSGDYNTKQARKWSVGEATGSYVVYKAEGEDYVDVPAGKAMYIGDDFYCIPQQCTAKVKVDYLIRLDQSGWIPQTEYIESLKTEWEPGRHYTYTLNLTEKQLTQTLAISSLASK